MFLPLGICEPHGQISALGLDTLKAEWLGIEAAKRVGGIVAPTLGYHIHESGYHARWLEDAVGEENAHMTAMPPHIMLPFFLYQLRAFANAGFRAIIAISGHSGGNQFDLRKVAEAFSLETGVPVLALSDPELVEGLYEGDHAGKYEISQLLYLRPDLVDFSQLNRQNLEGSGGRLALGDDALEASSALGDKIMHACLDEMCRLTLEISSRISFSQEDSLTNQLISYERIEQIWHRLQSEGQWRTNQPNPGQMPVSEHSRWKPFEQVKGK